MKRWGLFLGIGIAAFAVACSSEPTGPGVGGIALRLVSAGSAGQTTAGSLDSLRVKVTGPTAKTMDFACSSTTCSGKVDGLDPGTYAVTVAGIVGGAVNYYGTASSVAVTAGQNTDATIGNWELFQPVLTVPMDTTEVLSIPLSFTAVTLATSYVVEWSHAVDFTGANADTLTATTDTIAVADSGQYYVRVRAVNADVGSGGLASVAAAVYVTHGVATVTLTPATPTVAVGGTQQLTATAVDINGDTVQGVTFFWSSDNQSVASVSQSGLVTGQALGQATITAVGKGQPGSTTITVTAGAAAALKFMAAVPDPEPAGPVAPVQVAVVDGGGNVVTGATNSITVALDANPGNGTLTGTLTAAAVNGIATFNDLSIDSAGTGYTLKATATSLTNGTSAAFDVAMTFVQVGAALYYSCGLTTTGAVYCWGSNFNQQLGIGSATPSTISVPVRVGGNQRFSSLSVGSNFSCALRASDGFAFCWGAGANGRLGNNGTSDTGTPDSVRIGSAFLSISAGDSHACGIRASDGRVLCWGAAANGRLGNNTTAPDQQVPVLTNDAASYISVSAGGSHTCGVRQSDGRVLCWGAAANGRLGNNTTTPDVLVPSLTTNTAAYVSVTAGYAGHTCGLLAGGGIDAMCWGLNGYGQVGNGATPLPAADVLVPTNVTGGLVFASLSAGGWHTCGITAGGDGYCWGLSQAGRLGNGVDGSGYSTPQAIVGGHRFTQIDAGRYHGCGIANDGTYCWGSNSDGELGIGGVSGYNTPTPLRVKGTR